MPTPTGTGGIGPSPNAAAAALSVGTWLVRIARASKPVGAVARSPSSDHRPSRASVVSASAPRQSS